MNNTGDEQNHEKTHNTDSNDNFINNEKALRALSCPFAMQRFSFSKGRLLVANTRVTRAPSKRKVPCKGGSFRIKWRPVNIEPFQRGLKGATGSYLYLLKKLRVCR